jgi:hypothetical protein
MNTIFRLILVFSLIGGAGYAQAPLIGNVTLTVDTGAFTKAITFQLEFSDPTAVKEVKYTITTSDGTSLLSDDLEIEDKYGSLFFIENGTYKQLYGTLLILEVPLSSSVYDEMKYINFVATRTNNEVDKEVQQTVK